MSSTEPISGRGENLFPGMPFDFSGGELPVSPVGLFQPAALDVRGGGGRIVEAPEENRGELGARFFFEAQRFGRQVVYCGTQRILQKLVF